MAVTTDDNPVSDDIRNDTDSLDATKTTVSTGARGLVFIEKRGSGYKVGDYIVVKESSLGAPANSNFLVKVRVTSVNNQRS